MQHLGREVGVLLDLTESPAQRGAEPLNHHVGAKGQGLGPGSVEGGHASNLYRGVYIPVECKSCDLIND